MTADDQSLHRLGFKLKLVYSLVGLFLGLACIVGGVILGLHGVSGHTSWTASLLGFSTSMSDAAPGVVLFVVGIFMVWITRFKVREITETHNNATAAEVPEPADQTPSRAPSGSSSSSGRTVIDYHTGPKF
jgi:hypothetical protein